MKRQRWRKTFLFISAILFPVTMFYYSPYIIIHAALNSVVCGSFLLFAGMVIFSVFFGRLFCGYICAGAGFGEMAGCISDKKPKLGKLNLIKYGIWALWLTIVIALYIMNGGLKYVNPMYGTNHGISVTAPEEYIVYYIVVFLLFVMPLIFGKRAFCHYLCWMAPFMNLGIKIRRVLHLPGLYIHTDKEKCIDCDLCSKHCVMGLDVRHMVQTGRIDEYECSMCGACIDICPKKAICYRYDAASGLCSAQEWTEEQ